MSRNSLPSLRKCSWTSRQSPMPWATVLSGQVCPPAVIPSRPGEAFSAVCVAPSWYGPTPSTLNSASAADGDTLAEADAAPDGWPDDDGPEPVGGGGAAAGLW